MACNFAWVAPSLYIQEVHLTPAQNAIWNRNLHNLNARSMREFINHLSILGKLFGTLRKRLMRVTWCFPSIFGKIVRRVDDVEDADGNRNQNFF
jgi:hypothetical protein